MCIDLVHPVEKYVVFAKLFYVHDWFLVCFLGVQRVCSFLVSRPREKACKNMNSIQRSYCLGGRGHFEGISNMWCVLAPISQDNEVYEHLYSKVFFFGWDFLIHVLLALP